MLMSITRAPWASTHSRRLGHPVGLASGQLDRGRGLIEAQFGAGTRQRPGLHHFLAGHHLAYDKPRAEPRDKAPERKIGDAGQRCQQHRRVDPDVRSRGRQRRDN